jgi:transcriptional regulator with PAS, ATPase and Fis domain
MDIIKNICNITNDYVTLKNPIEKYNYYGIITCNSNMIEQIMMLNRIADKDTNILISGDTGTGKEIFAEYIHNISYRKSKRLVKLNCSTIPDPIFESEMFGYREGAFTGASKFGKKGLFELADKGTIFLDEIGEMPIESQSKLLRVIQEKTFIKIGSDREYKVDVRIISATNKDLKEMCFKKRFREDLYYRLNVFPIKLISLNDRKEDILVLAFNFLDEYNKKYGYSKKFSYSLLSDFLDHNWPGNVRELKNSVERLILLSTDDVINNTENINYKSNALKDNETIEQNILNLSENLGFSENKSFKELISDYEFLLTNYYINKYGSLRNAAKILKTSPATLSRKLSTYKKTT